MKKFLIIVASLLCFILARAAEHADEYYDPDVQRLMNVNLLAFGPVGFAGITSDGEKAFAALVRKKEAIRYVMQVFDHGTPEAQCYALIALREYSDELYDQCKTRFWNSSPDKIATMTGCIVSAEDTGKVLGAIERGAYRHYFTEYEAAK
jgi:hypothetical protein